MEMTINQSVQTKATAKQWITLLTVLSATFLSILNGFSSIVAIPAIQQELQATGSQIQLILAVYLGLITIFAMVMYMIIRKLHGSKK